MVSNRMATDTSLGWSKHTVDESWKYTLTHWRLGDPRVTLKRYHWTHVTDDVRKHFFLWNCSQVSVTDLLSTLPKWWLGADPDLYHHMALLDQNMLPKYLGVDFMRHENICISNHATTLAHRLLAFAVNDETFQFYLDNAIAADVLAI